MADSKFWAFSFQLGLYHIVAFYVRESALLHYHANIFDGL